jgi:surfeit locus 1 family protein
MIMVLLAVTLLCRLGFWQLSRAQEKKQLLSQWTQTQDLKPLSLENMPTPLNEQADLRFRSVLTSAQLLNEYTILLDNKIKNGQVGYHVIIPARLKNNQIILINRGWIPLGPSRQIIPTITPILGEISIEGYLDFAYRNPFIRYATEVNTLTWPLRMQWLDMALLSAALDTSIYPMLIVLHESSPYAFLAPQQQKEWLNPERHQGYAVQWFSLAVTLFVLYWFYLVKNTLKRKKEVHEPNYPHNAST